MLGRRPLLLPSAGPKRHRVSIARTCKKQASFSTCLSRVIKPLVAITPPSLPVSTPLLSILLLSRFPSMVFSSATRPRSVNTAWLSLLSLSHTPLINALPSCGTPVHLFVAGDTLDSARAPTATHPVIIFLRFRMASPGCAFFRVHRVNLSRRAHFVFTSGWGSRARIRVACICHVGGSFFSSRSTTGFALETSPILAHPMYFVLGVGYQL